MTRIDDLPNLIAAKQRRLQKLRERQALLGISTPPEVEMEIEDIEAELAQLQAELANLNLAEASPRTTEAKGPYSPSPRIFLCHASEDKPRVWELYKQLKAAGYQPWLDKEDLLPGQKWRREIEKIISDPYNIIVVCLSARSTTKRGVVQQEIKWALDVLERQPEDTIYLIPARLEACRAPDRLSDLHWVDLFEPDGFDILKRSLDVELGKRRVPGKPEEATAGAPVVAAQELQTGAPASEPEKPAPQTQKWVKRHPEEPEMIIIPAGEFWMGTDRPALEKAGVKWEDWMENETPYHQLYLPVYAIGCCPVTNAEYARFIQDGGYRHQEFWTEAGWKWREKVTQPFFWTDEKWNQADYPVVGVSWYECVAYCRWLSKLTGRGYRLPGEAEREKAARGPGGNLWPWGNKWDPHRCNSTEKGPGRTTPVGKYSPAGDSPYGVADMAGNVWEWCATKWGKNYRYDTAEDEWSPASLQDTGYRVVRGGSFYNNQYDARCACRGRDDPNGLWHTNGVRVVVSPI